jgi:hypothetical protein
MLLVNIFLGVLYTPGQETLAYLDPGSGSLIIQLLIGGIVGMIFLLKTSWGRIKSIFLGRTQSNDPQNEETGGVSEEQST